MILAKILVLVLLIIALIVVGPICTIWSLNTLFGLGIAYTIKTWAAAFFLGALVYGASKHGKDS